MSLAKLGLDMLAFAEAEDQSSTDAGTLALGIIGTVSGLLALAWNLVSHVLTGGRAKVTLLAGWLRPGGYMTIPLDQFPSTTPPAPFRTPVLAVVVSNVGRLPVSVTQWAVGVGAVRFGGSGDPFNKPLPHRLDVGEENIWFIELHQVLAVAERVRESTNAETTLRAVVTLGNGKTVTSKVTGQPEQLEIPAEP